MDFNEIQNLITGNPIYLAVVALIIVLIIYTIIKKFVKILILILVAVFSYVGYLYISGDTQTVEDVDKVLEQVKPLMNEGKEALDEVLNEASEKLKNSSSK